MVNAYKTRLKIKWTVINAQKCLHNDVTDDDPHYIYEYANI